MKITKLELQSIIKEELERMMEDGHDDLPSAVRKLKTAMEDAHEILTGLQHHQGELPAWWMSKVTIAADYLNKARDYFLVSGELTEQEKILPDVARVNKKLGQLSGLDSILAPIDNRAEFEQLLVTLIQMIGKDKLKPQDIKQAVRNVAAKILKAK